MMNIGNCCYIKECKNLQNDSAESTLVNGAVFDEWSSTTPIRNLALHTILHPLQFIICIPTFLFVSQITHECSNSSSLRISSVLRSKLALACRGSKLENYGSSICFCLSQKIRQKFINLQSLRI